MARPITVDELTKLRGRQSSRLYLALHQPNVIFSAQVNQTGFESEPDAVGYDNGSGVLADVKPGMTMLVGTTPGAHDVGIVRIRKEPTSTTMYIGRIGGIGWQNDLYLTVINEFRPWCVPVSYYNGAAVLDEDLGYADEHTQYKPVVVMGPPAVLWLSGSSVVFSPNAGASWVLDSTISAYSWSAPGASTTVNMDTASPQITYNAAGQYMVSCTVTAANGKSATGYRPVFVFGGDVKPVGVKSLLYCGGDAESGGWSAEVEVVDLSGAVVRDGTLAVLFTVDEWNGAIETIGVPDGYGNILMCGWVNGDTINSARGYGMVKLRVEGTAGWLARMNSLPGVIKKSEDTPQSWDEFALPTVNRVLWHVLTERSTLGLCTDIILDSDTRRLPAFDLSGGTLWEQMQQVCGCAQYTILSDRCGRVYGGIEVALRTQVQRSGMPVVMDITRSDWADEIVIHEQTERVGLLEIKGSRDDTPDEVIISRAPGYLPGGGGDWRTVDGMVFDNQDHANFLSGQMFAVLNNRFEVEITLGMNNRFVDICPAQYVTLTVAANETASRVIFNAAKFIPRRIEYQFQDGGIRTKLSLEKELFGTAGVTIVPESEAGDENIIPEEPQMPNYPLFPPPRSDWPEYAPPPVEDITDCLSGNVFTGPYILTPPVRVLDTENIMETEIFVPCKLRDGTVNHKSMVAITGYMRYQAGGVWYNASTLSDWTIEALDGNGNIVAVGVNSFGNVGGLPGRVSTFYPVGPLQIDRLRIRLSGAYGAVGNWSRTWNANYGWGGWKPAETTDTIGNDIYVDPVTNEWKVFRHTTTYWRLQDGKIGLKRDHPPDYTEARMVFEFPKNAVQVIGGVSKTTVMYPQDWTYAASFYHLTSNHGVVPWAYPLNLYDGLVKTYYWPGWESVYIEKIVINCGMTDWWECAAVLMEDYVCKVQRYQWVMQGVYLFNVCPL